MMNLAIYYCSIQYKISCSFKFAYSNVFVPPKYYNQSMRSSVIQRVLVHLTFTSFLFTPNLHILDGNLIEAAKFGLFYLYQSCRFSSGMVFSCVA